MPGHVSRHTVESGSYFASPFSEETTAPLENDVREWGSSSEVEKSSELGVVVQIPELPRWMKESLTDEDS